MEPITYLRSVLAHRLLVCLCVVLSALVALVAPPSVTTDTTPSSDFEEVASAARDRYVSAAVIGTPPAGEAVESPFASQSTGQFATLIFYLRHADVMRRFSTLVGYEGSDPTVPPRLVSLRPDPQTSTIVVTGFGGTPDQAVEHTTSFIVAAEDFFNSMRDDTGVSSRRAAKKDVEALAARLDRLSKRIQRLGDEATASPGPLERSTGDIARLQAEYTSTLDLYAAAYDRLNRMRSLTPVLTDGFVVLQPPGLDNTELRKPSLLYSPWLRLALGALVGLALGIAVALLMGHLRSSVLTRAAAERALGAPVLTEVPRARLAFGKARRALVRTRPGSATATAYLALGQVLARIVPREPVALETPASEASMDLNDVPGNVSPAGLPTIIEAARATAHWPTVIVIGHTSHEREYEAALSNLLIALEKLGVQPELVRSQVRNVAAEPPPRVAGSDMDLSAHPSLVLVDAGAITGPDFAAVASFADGVLILTEYRRTRLDDLRRARDLMALLRCRPLGSVLVQMPPRSMLRWGNLVLPEVVQAWRGPAS